MTTDAEATPREAWQDGPPPGWDDPDAPDVAPNGAPHVESVESVREPYVPPVEANGTASGEGKPTRTIEHVGPDAIFAPLPPIEWLCERLRLAGGQGVTCFAGYGYSGKTVVAQSIAISIASGRDVLGIFRCRTGRVLHLDYEQGSRVTMDRYQRLARAMGVSLPDLVDRLRLAVFPSVYLDSEDAADVFARTLDGFDLVIVDALRGAAPTLEENSSDVRRVIDLLSRQSERTGTLPLLLVHARKPTPGPKQDDAPATDARFSIRGSSAIFDACANVFVLGGAKGAPVRVEHEKDRLYGTPLVDFGMRIEDVAGEHEPDSATDPRWGLRVVHLDRAQLDAQPIVGGGALTKHADRIVAWLASKGGTFAGNKGALQKTISMNRTAFFAAFSTLEASERVRIEATKRTGTRISLIPEVIP